MLEQDWKPAASKFISSIVKFLYILCNSQIDFNESIELAGHINVRVDHKYTFDCIVDEQLSKEGENTATNLISNSYHPCPPSGQTSNICQLDPEVLFSELLQIIHEKTSQSRTSQDCLSQSHGFQTEDTLANKEEPSVSYFLTAESLDKQQIQANHKEVTLEEECDSMFLLSSLGDSNIKVTQAGGMAVKQEETRKLMKKTNPLFSCKEYLDKYNSIYVKKDKQSSKQEMMNIFSDLAKKYAVAITIKPAKFAAQTISSAKSNNVSMASTPSPLHSVITHNQEVEASSGLAQAGLQISGKSLALSRGTQIDNISDHTANQLSSTPATHSLQTESQIIAVVTSNPEAFLYNHPVSYFHSKQTLGQELECDIKQNISENIILSDTLIPIPAPKIPSAVDVQTKHRVIVHESSSSDSQCVIQNVAQSTVNRLDDSPSKIPNRISMRPTCDFVDLDTTNSALLNAIAVALAAETNSSNSFISNQLSQECLHQQPLPKQQRGNCLAILRKENTECYEQYKCLSKDEQSKERMHMSEANRDPNMLEKKSLMNRVMYFRRVNKLPPDLIGKSNDEIRCMSVDDLKRLLPPTKSLKNMDPVAREEWYRLGRSREWRHRKKLLDPEGFKRYNNERAKRYQDNLRKNNPEKYKELRAKGADRLRQYRFSQRIMKAMKEGQEIKMYEPIPTGSKLNRAGGKKRETGIEVHDAEEELLIEDNIDRAYYMIPEFATHGEAATGRESSSARTDQQEQPDILDFMYNY